ncbi:universal stress protein [Phenylobacterium hankyongense]|uniref:Universal stress protein n=1 Tax=Phenylobacterium hankyongense TaxID=1813876 RepID=A0A328B664_9CAUL|nr:universal stress protein [Phenylobacterium hankyongense]RAK61354.1 universal stress protein [Phenylobacterium hankyongense]
MSWARIMAPLSGGQGDQAAVAAAVMLAEPFGAEVAGVYTPADVADVMPWMGEGFLGGVQTTALESLKEAAAAGEASARTAMEACAYGKKRFIALQTPVWAGLSAESRLSDVVVFNNDPARGRGPLAEAFQQMLADEQRPVLIARAGLKVGGTAVVAWDGGKEASRAARLALPLLEKARRVVILAAPRASSRTFDPVRLQAYYAARGMKSEIEILPDSGDAAPALLAAAHRASADVLVAGAFGHPRLQEFIFGGTTRTLLNSEQPSLFLSH